MPHYPVIVDREKDEWLVWSTIVDAPITDICSEQKVKEYFKRSDWLDNDENWAGEPFRLDQCIANNRAGPMEEELSIEEIRKVFACPS